MNTDTQASPYSLRHVSNEDLHTGARRLVGRSNQLLAALLAHHAEVEARGLHRELACASLVNYCVYELRLSEDEAFRRAQAAKLARRFPIVFERVAAGEFHLTGLLLLGPHMTEENHVELLERAKHRTKKEIARLVTMVDPLPSVPAVIEPLGPGPVGIVAANSSTWARMTEAFVGPVRELEPGDRPKDWTDPAAADGRLDEPMTAGPPDELHALAPDELHALAPDELHAQAPNARALDRHDGAAPGGAAPSERPSLGPQRYKVQFTATQEYVDLVEEAKDLLAHAVRDRSLEEVHLRAMRALVDQLKTRKCALTNTRVESKPMETASPSTEPVGETQSTDADAHSPGARVGERQSGEAHAHALTPAARAGARQAPRRRGRYIPAAVRRTVWKRDGGRCTYVDATGQRCRERACLEFDHIDPYARGGPPAVSNLRLACRSHNGLAAEQVFGRDFIERKKGISGLEPAPSQVLQASDALGFLLFGCLPTSVERCIRSHVAHPAESSNDLLGRRTQAFDCSFWKTSASTAAAWRSLASPIWAPSASAHARCFDWMLRNAP